jgi:hypothetical protein
MKPAGLKTTKPRNSTDHRFGLSLSVASTNSDQLWWAPEAFGLIWKKEQTLGLILERKRVRGSGKTPNFKPPPFRKFQNVAERRER